MMDSQIRGQDRLLQTLGQLLVLREHETGVLRLK